LEAVASDFSQPTLRGFYLEGKGFVEMESVKRLVLKSSQETITFIVFVRLIFQFVGEVSSVR
jgi:hypothetical protein